VRGEWEDEVLVINVGDVYAVGTPLDDWYVVPADAARRFLATFLGVEEGEIELKC
jgi:hypothetical protein